uniref:Uncharacterized protein n=1 Tax=Kalmanozyma brasiliensis (strain GHG001) TaxID=1365824 RepID=V5GH15_KALBG
MTYRQAFSSFYARNFDRRPWITLAVTNGILGVVADGAAQTLERVSQAQKRAESAHRETAVAEVKEAKWDWSRSGRFLAFNVGMAPLLAEWNRFLEFRFPLRATPAAAGGAAAAGAAALGSMGYMERGSIDGVKAKFHEMYIPAMLANWQLWPLVQLVNFRYMPLKYRVPFVSTVGILWTIGLSLLSQSTRPKETPAIIKS